MSKKEMRIQEKRHFVEKHMQLCNDVFLLKLDHLSPAGKDIIELARDEVGYSDTTASCDIFRSIKRTWEAVTGFSPDDKNDALTALAEQISQSKMIGWRPGGYQTDNGKTEYWPADGRVIDVDELKSDLKKHFQSKGSYFPIISSAPLHFMKPEPWRPVFEPIAKYMQYIEPFSGGVGFLIPADLQPHILSTEFKSYFNDDIYYSPDFADIDRPMFVKGTLKDLDIAWYVYRQAMAGRQFTITIPPLT